MSTKAEIIGAASGVSCRVTDAGELVTAPLSYDETVFQELAEPNTAYNFYIPRAGYQFVVTTVVAYADKQVSSSTNTTVTMYEASEIDSTTEDKVLLKFELGQNQSLPLPGVHILVNPGKFINAKCDDDDVHMTVLGYYIASTKQVG